MATEDKANHKAEELAGKAKETLGKATGDQELEDQGKFDQAKSGVKQAADDVTDAVTEGKNKLKDAFNK